MGTALQVMAVIKVRGRVQRAFPTGHAIGYVGRGNAGHHCSGSRNCIPPEILLVWGPGTLAGTFWGPRNGVPPRSPLL